jgi:hypothetical protein
MGTFGPHIHVLFYFFLTRNKIRTTTSPTPIPPNRPIHSGSIPGPPGIVVVVVVVVDVVVVGIVTVPALNTALTIVSLIPVQ